MSMFPKGSVRAAVAAVGDAWTLLHEPNHAGEHNESLVAEIHDAHVMSFCDFAVRHGPHGGRRETMNLRAFIGIPEADR